MFNFFLNAVNSIFSGFLLLKCLINYNTNPYRIFIINSFSSYVLIDMYSWNNFRFSSARKVIDHYKNTPKI